jgi:hypothetical protein
MAADKSKLYSYFINRLGMKPYRRGWLKGDCPFCGRENKLGVSISRNKVNCFICGLHDSPIKTVLELENLGTVPEAWKYLGTLSSIEFKESYIKEDEIKRVGQIELPESFRLLSFGDTVFGKAARKYIRGRGFDPKELAMEGWGYCSSGKYMGYIIMPIYLNGVMIYYNARRYMLDGPKYNNPDSEQMGIGKSMIIYNMEALFTYKRVYMCEGLLNARTVGRKGISLGGKKISSWQLSTIIRSPVEEMVLLLDPDAMLESTKLAMDLSVHKKIKLVTLPTGKDVNDLGFASTLKYVATSKWLSYGEAYYLHNKYKYAGTESITTY